MFCVINNGRWSRGWVSALLRRVMTGMGVNSIFPVLCILLSLCCSFSAELRWSALMELRFWRKRLRVFRSALNIHILFELPPPALVVLCYVIFTLTLVQLFQHGSWGHCVLTYKHSEMIQSFTLSWLSCWSPVSRLILIFYFMLHIVADGGFFASIGRHFSL